VLPIVVLSVDSGAVCRWVVCRCRLIQFSSYIQVVVIHWLGLAWLVVFFDDGQLQPDFLSLLRAAMTPSLSGSSSGLRFLGEDFWISALIVRGGGACALVAKVAAKASSSSSC
jgi:hypothetical protein